MIHDDYISEGYALEDSTCCQNDRRAILMLMNTPRAYDTIKVLKKRYEKVKKAKTGSSVECPVCLKKMKKTTYNKVFCSNGRTKQGGNCKERYWNSVDDKRRERAKLFKQKP